MGQLPQATAVKLSIGWVCWTHCTTLSTEFYLTSTMMNHVFFLITLCHNHSLGGDRYLLLWVTPVTSFLKELEIRDEIIVHLFSGTAW